MKKEDLDINERIKQDDFDPIHFAIFKRSPEIVRLLISHPKIDLTIRDVILFILFVNNFKINFCNTKFFFN